MHELCSDWHAPYTGSIAPYSLSRGNPLKFTLFRNIHSWICAAQRLHARTSVKSYTSVNIYNFNSRLAHLYALWMEYIRSLRIMGGISCDVHFAGHLRSNRTNIWSDKSNIRNMQSGGARGLELRTAGIYNGFYMFFYRVVSCHSKEGINGIQRGRGWTRKSGRAPKHIFPVCRCTLRENKTCKQDKNICMSVHLCQIFAQQFT